MVTAAASDDEDAVTKPAIDPEVRAGQSRQALIYVSNLQRFCCCRHGSQAVPAALRDADGTASAEGLCCQSWSVARAVSSDVA